MVLPDSNGISRVPSYSGYISEKIPFRLQGCYLLWLTFPGYSSKEFLCNSNEMSYNPKRQASWFGLDSSSLAATKEIAFAFLSSRYLDVSVPWVCLIYPMYS